MNNKSSYYSINSINITHIFVSILTFLFGGLIYFLWRPTELLFFNLFNVFGLETWLDTIRSNYFDIGIKLPDWFVFSFPNALWAFSYSLLISTIWSRSKSLIRYFWIASIPILVLGFEILQYFNVIRGTFCIQDILFGIVGLTLGFIIANNKIIRL